LVAFDMSLGRRGRRVSSSLEVGAAKKFVQLVIEDWE
jgi:hypothetical protein